MDEKSLIFFIAVAQQLEMVVEKLVQSSFGKQLFAKVCSCLKAYRQACLEKNNAALYNDFLYALKHSLSQLKKTDLLLDIGAADIGLITMVENMESKATQKEAEQFFVVETEPEVLSRGEEKSEDDEDLVSF